MGAMNRVDGPGSTVVEEVVADGGATAAVLRTRGVVLAAAGAVMVGVWLLLGSQQAVADAHLEGEIVDFDILVADEPLTVGDTMVFTNNGDQPHTITDRGDTFDTNGIQPGETGEVTFDAVGTFEIFCRINPGAMNATVVVEPGDEPVEKVRVQTFDPNFDPRSEELRFDPPELQVQPGAEISVANVGGAPHTLTADDGTFDTEEIAPGAEEGRFPGDNASFVVDESGVFEFRCLIHPDAMRGSLIVAGDPLDDAPDDPPPVEEEPDPEPGAVDAIEIDMLDFSFEPFEVAVNPGAQMTWINTGSAPHTATFDEVEGRVEDLDTGTVDPGDQGVLTAPDAPGSYSYLCTIHPSMRGVVVVAADAVAVDDAAAEPDDDVDEAVDQAAAPAADTGDFSTAALIGAIALVVAGIGAIVIAFRGRRSTTPAD